MTWLEKDLQDLEELRDQWCSEHECSDCGFNISKNRPCLDEAVKTFSFTVSMIDKAKRRLEEYV